MIIIPHLQMKQKFVLVIFFVCMRWFGEGDILDHFNIESTCAFISDEDGFHWNFFFLHSHHISSMLIDENQIKPDHHNDKFDLIFSLSLSLEPFETNQSSSTSSFHLIHKSDLFSFAFNVQDVHLLTVINAIYLVPKFSSHIRHSSISNSSRVRRERFLVPYTRQLVRSFDFFMWSFESKSFEKNIQLSPVNEHELTEIHHDGDDHPHLKISICHIRWRWSQEKNHWTQISTRKSNMKRRNGNGLWGWSTSNN